jgi:hypothetical protein
MRGSSGEATKAAGYVENRGNGEAIQKLQRSHWNRDSAFAFADLGRRDQPAQRRSAAGTSGTPFAQITSFRILIWR